MFYALSGDPKRLRGSPVNEGRLKAVTAVWDGLDAAPDPLVALPAGENIG
jgi:NADPH-dependent curcumin reductase CurA